MSSILATPSIAEQRAGESRGPALGAATVRATLIGSGKISEQHILALRHRVGCEVAAICDLSPAMARFTAERFSIPATFTDFERMLSECEPQVVHVLTPAASHARIVRRCIEAGRHVIVEKPVALSHEEFCSLRSLAESKGVLLIENHNYRFNRPFLWLEERVADGAVGEVEEVDVRLALRIRDGGRYADANAPHPSHQLPAGAIHEFISHLCYLALRLCAAEPDHVRAAWRNLGGGSIFKYDDLDAVVGFGRTTARLRFTCRQWPDEFSVAVRGSRGQAFIEMFNPTCRLVRQRGGSPHLVPLFNSLSNARSCLASGFGGVWGKIAGRTAYEGLERLLNLTYDAIESGGDPPVTLDDMDRTSRLIDALLALENQV
ncbi:MAG: Gfo/Idh/MocA family oxidoreductase [Phycisphaerales bacterium]|nr:Gfo/Idh/MocA family oxidoreductase [Phycisphaerales bacterium]